MTLYGKWKRWGLMELDSWQGAPSLPSMQSSARYIALSQQEMLASRDDQTTADAVWWLLIAADALNRTAILPRISCKQTWAADLHWPFGGALHPRIYETGCFYSNKYDPEVIASCDKAVPDWVASSPAIKTRRVVTAKAISDLLRTAKPDSQRWLFNETLVLVDHIGQLGMPSPEKRLRACGLDRTKLEVVKTRDKLHGCCR